KLKSLSRTARLNGIENAHPVYRYPSAYLDAIIHVDDAEMWALGYRYTGCAFSIPFSRAVRDRLFSFLWNGLRLFPSDPSKSL
ncbi:hypothetical protein EXE48_18325, partial [Halorubrum sp. ASP1]|uniref:hypothetical protein n=1 Tax=Halorubrum sp. ASP1 TaxID=2518114 RepID=UPI0010F9D2AA